MKPFSLVCCWAWNPQRGRSWSLEQTFMIDDDGHPMEDAPDWTQGQQQPWSPWLSVLGRAVTVWTLSGVRLVHVNLPAKPEGIDPFFGSEVAKAHNWSSLIDGGSELSLGTILEAQDALFGEQA